MTAKQPTVSFRLEGKRALITGAGRGIGRAVAEALAAYGAHVLLLARSPHELEEVRDSIIAQGGSAEILSADVMDLPRLEAELSKREAFSLFTFCSLRCRVFIGQPVAAFAVRGCTGF